MKRLLMTFFLLVSISGSAQILNDTTYVIPIYNMEVRQVVVVDIVDALGLEAEDAAAMTYVDNKGVLCMVFQEDELSVNVVFHEIIHAVNYLCITRGIAHDIENDEPQAYLAGYLGERLFIFLAK